MRTPLVVLTGVSPAAMDDVLVSLTWDLPSAVSVRHQIDPVAQVLTRVVSDRTGVLEHEAIQLEHACVTCALREDILPTLARLARTKQWSTIVACLPVGAEAAHLGAILSRDARLARILRLASVVNTLASARAADDLLTDDLLREHDLHTSPDDERAVGEVACSMAEYADVQVLASAGEGPPTDEARDLVRALMRPDAVLVSGAENLDASIVTEHRHQQKRTLAWCLPTSDLAIPPLETGHAWRVELRSSRAFHPERLLEQIERLGTGRHRFRGCFWVPTRPDDAVEWNGAGGQLSMGNYSFWGRQPRQTRLVLTGLHPQPAELQAAFADLLLTPEEQRLDAHAWDVLEDGLEPWLGDIERAA